VHVGGTNGKGSVAVMVYEALRAAGHRVALYTSPHLVDIRERMIVDGRPIGRAAFAMWTERLRPTIDATAASFFEATTAVAFADFASRGADVAVIEVGLGGRLDATNVIDPLVAGVTFVGREHTDYLGSSLDGIAREKAGIAKAGRPLVVGETEPALLAAITDTATAAGATVVPVPPGARYGRRLALAGDHQRRNAAVAQEILRRLPAAVRPGDRAVAHGLAVARLPGRFERRGRWVFDVAHNPSGVATLLETLRETGVPRPVHALVGILRDKDWRSMLESLAAAVDALWITQPPTAPAERRWNIREAGAAMAGTARAEANFDRALELVQEGAATILVTGSFHTVGDAMARLPGFRPLG
jgi:dihydrofolate synthase/folylpolyglutamate synthase